MDATDLLAMAALIGALSGMFGTIGGLWLSWRKLTPMKAVMDDVKDQVTTINGSTLAMLGDAGETRRVEEIPPEDRTEAEQRHIEKVPDPDRPAA